MRADSERECIGLVGFRICLINFYERDQVTISDSVGDEFDGACVFKM